MTRTATTRQLADHADLGGTYTPRLFTTHAERAELAARIAAGRMARKPGLSAFAAVADTDPSAAVRVRALAILEAR